MTPKALLVGWDGVRYDTVRHLLRNGELPHLRSLTDDGLLAETRTPDVSVARTATAPGWCTILTGVWPTKHLVTANALMPTALDRYPDILGRAENARPRRRTMAALGAAMIAGDLGPGPLLRTHDIGELIFHDRRLFDEGIRGADHRVLADATAALATSDAQLSFVYFGLADKTAHLHGTQGEEYPVALRTLDDRLGTLLAALNSRQQYAHEDWLILVTTDHGHRDEGGHGGNSAVERQSFVAANDLDDPYGLGDDSRPAPQEHNDPGTPVEMVDIAPTLLTHLGMTIEPSWDLDGRPLQK